MRLAVLTKSFRDPRGLLDVHARQKDCEFISALSTEHCGATAERRLHHLGDLPQGDIPVVMAMLIIDGFKHINVAHQSRDRFAHGTRFGKGQSGGLVEPSTV
jgi:hypothetical protein